MIDYRKMLKDSEEEGYAEFQRRIVPGKENIRGVRSPRLKEIAKLIIKDDWRSFVKEAPESYEEEMLLGFVIANAPMDVEERIALTESFIPYIDNWATCDSFCCSWKFKKKESARVYDYFKSLISSGETYRMRMSLIVRMDDFMDDEHIDDFLSDIVGAENEEFYYKMGAAWAVSTCYVYYPEKTEKLLQSEALDVWTHNKSIQKICESRRIPQEDKERLRTLRRK